MLSTKEPCIGKQFPSQKVSFSRFQHNPASRYMHQANVVPQKTLAMRYAPKANMLHIYKHNHDHVTNQRCWGALPQRGLAPCFKNATVPQQPSQLNVPRVVEVDQSLSCLQAHHPCMQTGQPGPCPQHALPNFLRRLLHLQEVKDLGECARHILEEVCRVQREDCRTWEEGHPRVQVRGVHTSEQL